MWFIIISRNENRRTSRRARSVYISILTGYRTDGMCYTTWELPANSCRRILVISSFFGSGRAKWTRYYRALAKTTHNSSTTTTRDHPHLGTWECQLASTLAHSQRVLNAFDIYLLYYTYNLWAFRSINVAFIIARKRIAYQNVRSIWSARSQCTNKDLFAVN